MDGLHLSRSQRCVELARPWVLLSLFVTLVEAGHPWLAAPFALLTGLAGFVQMHDAVHASLGLSRRANDVVLFASGLLLLKSGHALRATHLRHHGRCLGDDDPEGAPATWPLWRALWRGPFHIFTLRWEALRIAPRTWKIQGAETVATGLILLAATLTFVRSRDAVGLEYWLVAAVVTCFMPVWAAYVPHRLAASSPAVRTASRVARLWTPITSSFAFHHLHHRHPRVPTARLADLARLDEGAPTG